MLRSRYVSSKHEQHTAATSEQSEASYTDVPAVYYSAFFVQLRLKYLSTNNNWTFYREAALL